MSMRIAVVSDIHANLTALEAVVADLRITSPDLVVHGGDLVGGGPRPADVIDRVRDLSWPGVYGNSDEMLWKPQRVRDVLQAPVLHRVRDLLLTHSIPAIRSAIGAGRLAWLSALPLRWVVGEVGVVHSAPHDPWLNTAQLSDEAMVEVFGALRLPRVVYGHTHQPFIRELQAFTLVNSGAVSQSFDGDTRAAYALLDGPNVSIRRVFYDVEAEVRLLRQSDDPFAPSTAEMLQTGRYVSVSAVP